MNGGDERLRLFSVFRFWGRPADSDSLPAWLFTVGRSYRVLLRNRDSLNPTPIRGSGKATFWSGGE